MEVDLVLWGNREVIGLLQRLSKRLEDGRPQLLGLVDQLLAIERERFAGRGVRWRRIAKSTVKKDAQEHRDPRLMILTQALLRSLTIRGAQAQIVRVFPTSLRFGTRLFYARFHQKGESVPKRPVVGLTRVQRKDLTEQLRVLLIGDL